MMDEGDRVVLKSAVGWEGTIVALIEESQTGKVLEVCVELDKTGTAVWKKTEEVKPVAVDVWW